MSERVYDIKQAAELLGYTPQYIRMLIQDGKLVSERVPISPGARVTKHVMTEDFLEQFKKDVQSRTRRDDNRSKWLAYATFAEMLEVITLLEEKGLTEVASMIRPANKLKTVPDWLKERLNDSKT